jgi:hypothetical protein
MATRALDEQWQAYKEAFWAFDGLARDRPDADQEFKRDEIGPVDHALCELAGRSERLASNGIELLQGATDEDRERISTLLIAVATADLAIASEALQLGPERPQPDPEFVEVAAGIEVESARTIVASVDELFGPSAALGGLSGGEAITTQQELLQECGLAMDQLVGSAYDPALRFGLGAASVGVAHLVMPAVFDLGTNLVTHLERLERKVGWVKRHVVRLIATAFRKLIGVAAKKSDELADEATKFLVDHMPGNIRNIARQALETLLSRVGGREMAERGLTIVIAAADGLTPQVAADICQDMQGLTSSYAEQMIWTQRIAKLVSFSAPFISTLAAPIGGPLLVVALDGIGMGFVVTTLRARVTGRLAGQDFNGVVTIVNRRV